MKTALVTGGCGFIGSEIVKALDSRGYNIIVLDCMEPKEKLKTVDYVKGDVRDKELLEKVGKYADYIYHTAGILGTSLLMDRLQESYDINVTGSMNVFDLASKTKATVINLGLIPTWKSPYMLTKNFIKEMGSLYNKHSGTDIKTVELTHAYGPGQSPYQAKAVPNFIIKALTNKDMIVLGDPAKGFKYMDLIYASDAAEALVRIAENDNIKDEILQLGCGDGIPVDRLAKKIAVMCNSKSSGIYEPMRAGEPDGREEDFTSADLSIWYKFFKDSPIKTSVEDGLKHTIDKYRNDLAEGKIEILRLKL